MKWEQIQGKWQEYKGHIKQRWGKLTDQDLMVIDGKRDVLAGKLRERTGAAKEQIEKEIAEFEAACRDTGKDSTCRDTSKATASASQDKKSSTGCS